MLIIGTALYAALTIIYVPILLVFVYMIIINKRYKDLMNVYNFESSTGFGIVGFTTLVYLFLTGFCIGDLPSVWTSMIFITCFVGSIFISITICKLIKFFNRDRIKYANILLADEQICNKIKISTIQLSELKKIMNHNSLHQEQRDKNFEQLTEIQEILNKLATLHQELQQQKILMNASISTSEMKNVIFSDGKSVNAKLDYEKDKIENFKLINDNYRSVRSLIKKYNI